MVKKLILGSLLSISLCMAACQPKQVGDISSQSSVSGAVGQSEPYLPNDPMATKKVRLQLAGDVQKLEYLDPTSAEEKWLEFATVEKFPVGTFLYHWGPEKDVNHWATKGIEAADIDRAVRAFDGNDMFGGGFYVSTDPVDSITYGPRGIVAELKEEMISLNVINVSGPALRYEKEKQSLLDPRNQVLIPVPMLAEAGIQSLHYMNNWHVTISGKPLSKLFEISWDHLLLFSKKSAIKPSAAIEFATNYPVSDELIQREEFKKTFPAIAKYLNKETLTDSELIDIGNALMSSQKIPSTGPFLGLIAEVKVKMRPQLLKSLKEAEADVNNPWRLDYEAMQKLTNLKMSLSQLSSEYKSAHDPSVNYENLQPGIIYKINPEVQALQMLLPFQNFYKVLNALVDGKEAPLVKPTAAFDPANPWPTFQTMNEMGLPLFLKLAKLWTTSEVSIRDVPMQATGSHFLDGPEKPGYIEITAKQKAELEAFPYILPTFKEMPGPQDKTRYFVHYEYPSAKIFRHIEKAITRQETLRRLRIAEEQGLLKTDTPESRELTKAILEEVIAAVTYTNSSPSSSVTQLLKLQVFKDEELNKKFIASYIMKNGSQPLLFMDDEWAKVACRAEIAEVVANGYNFTATLFKTISNDTAVYITAPMNLEEDIGYWELAAMKGGPHKDPANFIRAVKARFKSPEVQQWIQENQTSKVTKALHAAAVEAGR